MSEGGAWRGALRFRRDGPGSAERLFRALAPEAAREVPRVRARLDRPSPTEVRIELDANDTGAMRAAVNTYLGWVALAERTEAAARRPGASSRSAYH